MENFNKLKEWGAADHLPSPFVQLINHAVSEYRKIHAFVQIAAAWDVDAGILSRWMAGMGPLSSENIRKLVKVLGPGVYTALGIMRPENSGNPENALRHK